MITWRSTPPVYRTKSGRNLPAMQGLPWRPFATEPARKWSNALRGIDYDGSHGTLQKTPSQVLERSDRATFRHPDHREVPGAKEVPGRSAAERAERSRQDDYRPYLGKGVGLRKVGLQRGQRGRRTRDRYGQGNQRDH